MVGFQERRKGPRYLVEWHGFPHAQFARQVHTVSCDVCEISRGGARLRCAGLLAGSRHLVADGPDPLQLEVMLPIGLLTLPLACRWYDYSAETGLFVLGVAFTGGSATDLALLNEVLRQLGHL